jgi:hypothetical protein
MKEPLAHKIMVVRLWSCVEVHIKFLAIRQYLRGIMTIMTVLFQNLIGYIYCSTQLTRTSHKTLKQAS